MSEASASDTKFKGTPKKPLIKTNTAWDHLYVRSEKSKKGRREVGAREGERQIHRKRVEWWLPGFWELGIMEIVEVYKLPAIR